MKVLVLGGTGFFGKRLVQRLIDAGDEVTVATRGQAADPFGDSVERIKADRQKREDLEHLAEGRAWDVIYDNIGFASQDALDAAEVFAGKTKHYVLTSSLSVYEFGSAERSEEEVDTLHYPVTIGTYKEFDYSEGKRQAEAVLLQQASFPVSAVRFPFVIGIDDYTERLLFHIRNAMEGKAIQAIDPDAQISFISSEEAAEFLFWLGRHDSLGAVNACAAGTVSLRELMKLIEVRTGKSAVIETVTEEAAGQANNLSPYAVSASFGMTTRKAAEAGFHFSDLKEWLPGLITQLASSISNHLKTTS
ncbi:NAD-dependent dehydratase [Paenibacillus sp. CAA11]|uniref:NAD-dependent epimerase/dehydratase family protein n=1 Tax=Paenibacillus sp. CAA11 TaxID=1532905 RepID=UPI000D341F59|nr:NAD-dependent epimerase/dehydratase family protein [Paenibacillus sp. CAA11]AWB46033.1 NAD-dependent dehydratase [Paenibacillus sp. CAA11]